MTAEAEYKDNEYVKLTCEDNCNRGFQYSEGLNVDENLFDEKGQGGGLYFSRFKHIAYMSSSYGPDCNIWRVSLLEDEPVVDYGNCLKAHRIILRDCRRFYENEKLCELAVQYDGYNLRYVKHQTERICLLAVRRNGLALQFVKDQTEHICEMAVANNGML